MKMILILAVLIWMTAIKTGSDLMREQAVTAYTVNSSKVDRRPGISEVRQLSSVKPLIKQRKAIKQK